MKGDSWVIVANVGGRGVEGVGDPLQVAGDTRRLPGQNAARLPRARRGSLVASPIRSGSAALGRGAVAAEVDARVGQRLSGCFQLTLELEPSALQLGRGLLQRRVVTGRSSVADVGELRGEVLERRQDLVVPLLRLLGRLERAEFVDRVLDLGLGLPTRSWNCSSFCEPWISVPSAVNAVPNSIRIVCASDVYSSPESASSLVSVVASVEVDSSSSPPQPLTAIRPTSASRRSEIRSLVN